MVMVAQKEVLCYCWLDTQIERKEDGSVHHNGGRCIAILLNERTSRSELLTMLASSFDIDLSDKVIKYTLKFDRSMVVELVNDMAMENFVRFNEEVGFMYVFSGKDDTNMDVNATRKVVNVEQGAMHPTIVCGDVVDSTSIADEGPAVQCVNSSSRKVNMDVFSGKDDTNMDVDATRKVVSVEQSAVRPIVVCGDVVDSTSIADEAPAVQCINSSSSPTSSALFCNEIIGPGQTFENPKAFRDAVYKLSLATQFNYTFRRNTLAHINIRCVVDGCPFKLTANRVGKTSFMTVGTFNNKHVHPGQDMTEFHPKVSTRFIGPLVESSVRRQPNMSVREICAFMKTKHNVTLSYSQAWRCKEAMDKTINGSPDESYKLLPWLCARIQDADPDSHVAWKAEDDGVSFHQLFVAYGCSILGFLSGCRPIVFIDSCHLSGSYRGTLLSATSLDADDHMYPLAYAVVSAESDENWHWFLGTLKANVTRHVHVIIVSDRNPYIISGVHQVFGREWHAYCYSHIKENFSVKVNEHVIGRNKGNEIALKLLDSVAYARVEVDYNVALERMRKFCPKLADWVENNEPERWAMSKFLPMRWDWVTTNAADCFNSWVVEYMRLPIYSFVNKHRDMLANKLNKEKKNIETWKSVVGPNIEAKLADNVQYGEHSCLSVSSCDTDNFRVIVENADLFVNLQARECTCRAWQMSGIPCGHACAAIKVKEGNIYDYVDSCYHKSQQQAIYTRLVTPIDTHDAIPHDLNPPRTKRPPGRPPTKCKESQFIKKRPIHCSKCKEPGHNRAGCTNPHRRPASVREDML